ncbi:hypothetical protein JVT61DRAFT_15130 [Boletus reticuloceps]|uniref:Uncharacterized protein n=1 Tax=Boletus reticuloceps TaxID=495285 RepID=A0A8I2YSL6_9AGAM|nr:hypothetical protein JVT61DRAFT_15130 [Boletus reticuloceps]
MVPKTASVLSHLLPARLGLGSNHRPDPATRTRNQEKHPKEMLVLHDRLGDPELDPFRVNSLSIHRPTDPGPRRDRPDLFHAPSDSLPPPLLIPNGGVREPPALLHRVRTKRSSFTNFFAFSSKRRSSQVPLAQLQTDLLVPPQAVSGKWVPGSGQTQVHLVNAASIPSPLRADEEEYYYSYYPPSHPATPNPGSVDRSPSKQLSWRQQDLIGHPGIDSQLSSPVDSHPAHTQIRHPYAYSTPLYSKPPPLRHVASQPLHHYPQDSRSGVRAGLAYASSHHGHDASKSHSHFLQPEIKTSMSTPNLTTGTSHVRHRSLLRKRPTRSKGQERWLSAESWWDALFSPSPRFKIKQAPRLNPPTEHLVHHSVSPPPPAEPNRNLAVTFPSIQATRPRALSATSPTSSSKPVPPSLTRSRSALELIGQPSTSVIPHPGFLPALETLAHTPTPPPDLAPPSDPELSLPESTSLVSTPKRRVLDEVQAFEQQRAQWKHQAARSLGNKHTRSFSRARSKSLGERHVRLGRHTSESSKAHLNFEFLAARTLLGSQSMMPVVHVTKPCSTSFPF